MNLSEIFTKRWRQSQDLFLKNAKYIFNDHAILVMFFLFGALAFQYSGWVAGLIQGQVPMYAHLIWTIIVSLTIFVTGIATYLIPADLVFLLPMESTFDEWFRPALNQSLLFPSGLILLVVAGSFPLLSVMAGYSVIELLVLALILICFKMAHLNIQLESWHFTSNRLINVHKVMLYVVVFITVFLASYVTPYLCLGIALIYLVVIHFTGIRPFAIDKKRWHWEKIIAAEQKRQQQINRTLALFITMPQEASPSKRRKYFDFIIKLTNKDSNPYTYLFSRSFWRSNEYYLLWMRMTLVGMAYLIFVPNNHWLSVLVMLAIQYFSHFQVLPLAQKLNQHLLLQVYPIDPKQKVAGFSRMMWQPMCTQIVLFILASSFIHTWTFTGLLALTSVLLAIFFILSYIPRFMNKKEKKGRIG